MKWTGVMPALTTAFDENLHVDHAFIARHAQWQIENGVSGLVALGSLGEAATLALDEKLAIIDTLVNAAKGKVPVVAAISSSVHGRGRAGSTSAFRRATRTAKKDGRHPSWAG